MNHTSNTVKGFLFAALGSIGWGISGVCSQYLFSNYQMPADWLTAIRMLCSGLVLLLITLPKGSNHTFGIWETRKDVFQLLAFALIGLLMCQYTFFSAVKHSNSATATVLQSLNVILMAVVMAVYHKTHMKKLQIVAIILALAGTYLIATNGNLSSMTLSSLGLTFGLLAAVGVVTYTLLSRPIIASWGNLTVTGWGMLIGGAVLFVITKAWIFPSGLDAMAWLMIATIIFIGTAFGFSAFLEGVKYIGPVKATLINCLEPASATLLSAVFLGTHFSVAELIGFCCIILTVFLSVSVDEK